MKTVKEAAREYSAKCYPHMEDMRFQCETHFEAAVEWAEQWISIEDRDNLMPTGQPLFLKDENGRVWTDSEFEQEIPFVIITHWRPIEHGKE